VLSVEDGYRSVHGFSKIFPRVVSLPIMAIMCIHGARPNFQSLIAVKTTEYTLHVCKLCIMVHGRIFGYRDHAS